MDGICTASPEPRGVPMRGLSINGFIVVETMGSG